jgi:hypothetical protein
MKTFTKADHNIYHYRTRQIGSVGCVCNRGVAAIDSTIDSSIVSNLTTTIDFFNSKGTISIVDAIKHVEKTNVMTKIIFKI